MADATRASKLQFFFCSGSFSFVVVTQFRQVKVVFLRTLRNAATRLVTDLDCVSFGWVLLDLLETFLQ